MPNKFDFLKEKNQYQLNALAEFLFEKYGFETLTEGTDYPADLTANRCLALKSDVLKIAISTKLDGLPQRMILNRTLDDLERSSKIGMLIRAIQNGMKYKAQTGMSLTQTIRTAWGMASKTDMTLGQTMMASNAPMIIQKAMVESQPNEGVLPSGQIAGLIDDLPSCAEIVSVLISDAEASLKRVGA